MGIIETIKLITREEALEEGEAKKSYEFVSNLLLNTDFDTAKIASLVGVPESFVTQLQRKLCP